MIWPLSLPLLLLILLLLATLGLPGLSTGGWSDSGHLLIRSYWLFSFWSRAHRSSWWLVSFWSRAHRSSWWLVSFWSRANCSSCWLVSFYRHVLTAAPGGWSDYCHVQTAVLVVGPFLVKCSPQLQDWLDFGHVLFTVLVVGQILVTWSFSFLWLARFWSRALSQSCIWQRQSAGTEVIVHAWTGGAKQLSNCKFIELKSFISPFSVGYAQLIALLNWSVLIL